MNKFFFSVISSVVVIILSYSVSYSQNIDTFSGLLNKTINSVLSSSSQIKNSGNTQKKDGAIPIDIPNTAIQKQFNRSTKIELIKNNQHLSSSRFTRIKINTKTDEGETLYDSENTFERKADDESGNAAYDKLIKSTSKIVYSSPSKAVDTMSNASKIFYLWNQEIGIIGHNPEFNGIALFDGRIKKANATWTDVTTADGYTFTSHFTVGSINNGIALVTYSGASEPAIRKVDTPKNANNAYSSVKGSTYKGTLHVNIETGLITKLEVDNTITNVIQMMGQDAEYSRTCHVSIDNKVK